MATTLSFSGDHSVFDWMAIEYQVLTAGTWTSMGTTDALATEADASNDNDSEWVSVLVPYNSPVAKGNSFVISSRRYVVHDDELPPGGAGRTLTCRFAEWI